MNDDHYPTMLDLVKALSDADRLKIIGALTMEPLKAAQVAEATGLPFTKTIKALAFLEFVGMLTVHAAEKKKDEVYTLDTGILEWISRQQFEGTRLVYAPGQDPEQERQKTLAAFLNLDGSIRQIPNSRSQPTKFHILLDHVAGAFEVGKIYTEREVNAILKRFHADFAGLRRDLVDAALLARERDGSKYWRTEIKT